MAKEGLAGGTLQYVPFEGKPVLLVWSPHPVVQLEFKDIINSINCNFNDSVEDKKTWVDKWDYRREIYD